MTAPSPHQISTFDSPGNPPVPCMLTGENYDTWAMAMKNALLARKKNSVSSIETLPRPNTEAPEYQSWPIYKSMVVVA